jgi:hypothetical protein
MHQSNQWSKWLINPMKHTPKHRQNKRGAKKWILKLSLKWGDLGARTASFGIIGHQMPNWEWNFTIRNTWDPN